MTWYYRQLIRYLDGGETTFEDLVFKDPALRYYAEKYDKYRKESEEHQRKKRTRELEGEVEAGKEELIKLQKEIKEKEEEIVALQEQL